MPHRHLKLLIISNLRYVYFSHHHGGFPLALKNCLFPSTARIYGNCGVPWMHPSHSSPSLRPVAANCREIGKWKCCELKKKRRSLFEFYDSAELIFLGFCEKKSMGILPNSRFQDFQTGIVSAKMITFGPSTPVIMGTNNRYTLVNMAKNHWKIVSV